MFENGGWGLYRRNSRGTTGGWYPGTRTSAGDPVGIPAVSGAIRLISEAIGSFVMRVYEGDASKRQPVFDAPQAALLQDGALDYCTSVDTWSSVVTSIEIWGHGLLYKGRAGGKVAELYAFPPEMVCIYVDDRGRKVIEARTDSQILDITNDVIHVKGWSPIVGVTGDMTLKRHARTLNGTLALQEFRGRYFDSDETPNLLLIHPGNPAKQARDEFRESWANRHRGPDGDKTGFLWGGITAEQLGKSLEQSQVEQLMNLDVEDIARMFGIYPRELLTATEAKTLPLAETVTDLFQRFTLLSRERRIERAISGDREIFPNRVRYCRFDSTEFTRGSIEVTAEKVHKLKQVGMITANEGRSELGLPPSDDPNADTLLETPVGAGANQSPGGQA